MLLARSRFPRALATAAIWLASSCLASGCKADPPAPPPLPGLPGAVVHWPVPAAPPVSLQAPVLWVALAAHLHPPEPVVLRSAKGNLRLIGPAGEQLEAPAFSLRWRDVPLAQPLLISRQVLGPFASYESAQAVAQRWRQQGAQAVVAHPAEWEVWAPAGAPSPLGQQPRHFQQRQSQRLGLVVTPASGAKEWVLEPEAPVQLEAPGGLRWQGGVYAGPFRLQGDATGRWTLVEVVPLERYLLGVVPYEIGAGAPAAALEAQAVLARTWALRNQGRFAVDGYHLCADTQCQVYGEPGAASGAVRRAVEASRSLVLSFDGQPIHAVYHASNGGVSAGYGEVWGGAPWSYLRAAIDAPASGAGSLGARLPLPLSAAAVADLLAHGTQAYGNAHPRFRWTRSLDAAAIARAVAPQAPALGVPQAVQVLERGASGRVLALKIQGPRDSLVLRLDGIRRTLRQLPSTLFVVRQQAPGLWLFEGGGFGHGAGLSQAGAIDLASRGWGLRRILEHYYPGTALQPLSALKP